MAIRDHLDPRRIRGTDVRLEDAGVAPGGATANSDGTVSERFGSNFVGDSEEGGVPLTSKIVRSMDIPRQPCVMCRHFRYDSGQQFFDSEGLGQVSGPEGGFMRPEGGTMQELATGEGGIYDSREYGACTRWSGRLARRWGFDSRRARSQLAHRFSTCEEWILLGKF